MNEVTVLNIIIVGFSHKLTILYNKAKVQTVLSDRVLRKIVLKDILPITLKEKDLQLFTKHHQMP